MKRTKFRIGKHFWVLGRKIKVGWCKDMVHTENLVAFAFRRGDRIRLQKPSKVWPRTRYQLEQTFLHELLHICLGEGRLSLKQVEEEEENPDEGAVDMLAGLLHQALTTME